MRTWLVTLRKEKGFSQKEVATKASISQPTYCDIEHKKLNPGVKTAKRIASVLGFDWTEFYRDRDAPSN